MVNVIPETWVYTPAMENLFYFYQCSEELLSYTSPDSYRLPVCNCMNLSMELRRVYNFLAQGNQITNFYSKYIPCIIDELIIHIQDDPIVKNSLGLRLDSFISGITSAKNIPEELIKWLNVLKQSCTLEEHKKKCAEQIIENVKNGNNKKKLLWLIENYYIDLIILGYSPEYLYQSTIRFFDNYHTKIENPDAISDFLDRFNGELSDYEFWVVADTYRLGNLSKILPQLGENFNIQEIDENEIKKTAITYPTVQRLHSIYLKKKSPDNESIKLLSCKEKDIDPYSAFNSIERAFDLAQCFEGYFKHKSESKSFFDVLLVNGTEYTPIKMRKLIPSRPIIDQEIINNRIETILNTECCHREVIYSIFRAIDMHLDAINCKSEETMLRTFWTALEALFFTSDKSEKKENAKLCILHIIQKTYLLKQFRLLYEQLISAIGEQSLRERIGAKTFQEFVLLFMSKKADDPGFRLFTEGLNNNPLLRSRLYWLRKEVEDPRSIIQKIENHFRKVSWQIDRIYRTRNLITHAGLSMPYINEILFNVHNYFDYIINYIICKLENHNYIQSIASMIFEAKNDNQIHLSYLKRITALNDDNYLYALFGPDLSIVSFDFEAQTVRN